MRIAIAIIALCAVSAVAAEKLIPVSAMTAAPLLAICAVAAGLVVLAWLARVAWERKNGG